MVEREAQATRPSPDRVHRGAVQALLQCRLRWQGRCCMNHSLAL
jgi:hypothetical protein